MTYKNQICKILILISLFNTITNADMFTPNHNCSKPFKPYSFTTQYDIDLYKIEVEAYKTCIEDFIRTQENEIMNHIEAKKRAIKDWNSFIEYELK